MKPGEQRISWSPVPLDANRYMELGVAYFEQLSAEEGAPISFIVVSSTKKGRLSHATDYAWRVWFEHVSGFRFRPIDLQPPVSPALRPAAPGDVALWEVESSQWLKEAVGILHSHPQLVRHFVIAGSDLVYDIAAQDWSSEELGEWGEVSQAMNLNSFRSELTKG